jgi:hypothetical protein
MVNSEGRPHPNTAERSRRALGSWRDDGKRCAGRAPVWHGFAEAVLSRNSAALSVLQQRVSSNYERDPAAESRVFPLEFRL